MKECIGLTDWDDCQGSHREKALEEMQIWEKCQLTRRGFSRLSIEESGEKEVRILSVPLTCSSWCRSKTMWTGVRQTCVQIATCVHLQVLPLWTNSSESQLFCQCGSQFLTLLVVFRAQITSLQFLVQSRCSMSSTEQALLHICKTSTKMSLASVSLQPSMNPLVSCFFVTLNKYHKVYVCISVQLAMILHMQLYVFRLGCHQFTIPPVHNQHIAFLLFLSLSPCLSPANPI